MSQADLDSDDLFSGSEKQEASTFDVKALLQTAARYYWIVFLTLGLALAGALIYLNTVLPMYRSTAEIRVESRSATPGLSLPGSGGTSEGGQLVEEDLLTTEHSFLN